MQTFGGVPGVPSVVDYRLVLVAKRKGVFEIDSAWVEEHRLKLDIDRKTKMGIIQDGLSLLVEKGDSVFLRGSFEIPMPCENCPPPPTHLAFLNRVPIETEDAFVLRLRYKGTVKYLSTSEIERLPDQNMP